MRRYNRRNNGSVLVMVLGMLTLLFLLGSTFLVVTHMNAKTSDAVASTSQKEPVSEGIMATIKAQVAAGRNATLANGPYGAMGTGPVAWKKYIDYPDKNVTSWLAQNVGYSETGASPGYRMMHVSDLTGEIANVPSNGGSVGGVFFSGTTNSVSHEWVPGNNDYRPVADVNCDGRPEGFFVDSGVTNNNGEKYYQAVQIVDTSACMNVNAWARLERSGTCNVSVIVGGSAIAATSGLPAAPATGWTPGEHVGKSVRITYASGLVATGTVPAETTASITGNTNNMLAVSPAIPAANNVSYEILDPYPADMAVPSTTVISQRSTAWSGAPTGPPAPPVPSMVQLIYAGSCGSRVYAPSGNYRPFGVDDEAFLRFNQPGNMINQSGRLRDALALSGMGSPTDYTTISCSPNISRTPSPSSPTRFLISRGTLDDAGSRDKLVNNLMQISFAGGGESPEKEISHLVANLWAASSAFAPETNPFALSYTYTSAGVSKSGTVYGLVEQLAIVEAYAWHSSSTNYVRAVEIMNPTNVQIPTSYGGQPTYRLKCNTSQFDLPAMTIDPGARVVVYSYTGRSATVIASSTTGECEMWNDGNLPGGIPANTTGLSGTGGTRITLSSTVFVKDGILEGFESSSPDRALELYRVAYPASGAVEILADNITPKDISYTMAISSTGGAHGARDDAVDFMPANDTRPATHRAFLPVYVVMTTTTGKPTFATQTSLAYSNTYQRRYELAFATAMEGYWIRRSMPGSPGDLADLYLTGPEIGTDGTKDFPHALKDQQTHEYVTSGTVPYMSHVTRGRLVPVPDGVVSSSTSRYPDVPAHSLIGEMVSFAGGDSTRPDEPVSPLRIYGRLNINTATPIALRNLPFPKEIWVPRSDGAYVKVQVNPDRAAQYILAYRDKLPANYFPGLNKDYTGTRQQSSNVVKLREVSWDTVPGLTAGFASPGELAIPLADYANELMGWTNYTLPPPQFNPGNGAMVDVRKINGYVEARDSLYRAVSKLVTVNSDTFAANIQVQLRDVNGRPKFNWYYLAVFDRSNMTLPRYSTPLTAPPTLHQFDDTHPIPEPAVLMFTRMLTK